MLYPLSYEGARAQSSDPDVQQGWQGVADGHPVTRTRVCPVHDHGLSTRPRVATGPDGTLASQAYDAAGCARVPVHASATPERVVGARDFSSLR